MKQNSVIGLWKIAKDTCYSVAFLFCSRSLFRSIGGRGILWDILRVVLLTVVNYKFFRFLSKDSGNDAYFSRISFSMAWVAAAFLVIGTDTFILTRLPGEISYNPISADYMFHVFFPLMFDLSLAAGISEEIVFRGYLMKAVEQNSSRRAAVFYSSFVFGALHLLNTLLPPSEALLMLAYTTGVGVLFAILTLQSGNIGNAVAVHICVNMSPLIFALKFGSLYESIFSYSFSSDPPTWLVGDEYSPSVITVLVIWASAAILYLALCRNAKAGKQAGRA